MKITITSRFPAVVMTLLRDLQLVLPQDELTSRGETILLSRPAARSRTAGDFAAFQCYAQPIKLIDGLKIEDEDDEIRRESDQ